MWRRCLLIFSVPVPRVFFTPLAVSIVGRGASSEALAFLAGARRTFVYVDASTEYAAYLKAAAAQAPNACG